MDEYQVTDNTHGPAGNSVLERSFNLLEYLSAVAREVGPKPVRDVRKHHPNIWPSGIPRSESVRVGVTASRSSWLEVDRLPAPPPAEIPEPLDTLLESNEPLRDPAKRPALSPDKLRNYINALLESEFDEIDRIDVHRSSEVEGRAHEVRSELEGEFEFWMQSDWESWAENSRETAAVRELYSQLYELHLRSETESATHELVWGHLVLSFQEESEVIVSPLLTTAVTMTIDPDSAMIKVVVDGVTHLELDAIEGTSIPGIEGLSRLKSKLRNYPPDPWSEEARDSIRKQILAPLGVDAVQFNSHDAAPITTIPQLNDGWVLFLRKRPLRQERFYDALAHNMLTEGVLPEALASVVADKEQVDRSLMDLGQAIESDDGTAQRLLMPLPSNDQQERIARQLARNRGVTVQGPPGTGKSHTIVNLVSHLVAQGKRVLVTAEKEQALSVLRDKIPGPLRDLSIAVLGSTPAAMEDLRSAAESMQDSLSDIDVQAEGLRIRELNEVIDRTRERISRIDASLVEALRSESREYDLPGRGRARAADVAKWLAENRSLDVIADAVPPGSEFPLNRSEFLELVKILQSLDPDDVARSLHLLPDLASLPSTDELRRMFNRRNELSGRVATLEDRGLNLDAVDQLSPEELVTRANDAREAARNLSRLKGEWEDQLSEAVLANDPLAEWIIERTDQIRGKLSESRHLADQLAGHVISLPSGDPQEQLDLVKSWAERIAGGKSITVFTNRRLKSFSTQVKVDGYPVSTVTHLELARTRILLDQSLQGTHTLTHQVFSHNGFPVPALDDNFLLSAERLTRRIGEIFQWWSQDYPRLTQQLSSVVSAVDPASTPESLLRTAELLEAAGVRAEQRALEAQFTSLTASLISSQALNNASPLWSDLLNALRQARLDKWDEAVNETSRLQGMHPFYLRSQSLLGRIAAAGAPQWAESIRGGVFDCGARAEDAEFAWKLAAARTWLSHLHAETAIEELMEESHTQARLLRESIVDLARRSAHVHLKNNTRDRQRRALVDWLNAVKKVGKGTGKNAPRYQAAARDALPAAMGAVPIWIMPIYRVLENFDPNTSELFDVVVVDESSQCDLLTLGVLALGKKSVVVGDDKQTTPERPGMDTGRVSALQDQYLKDVPGAKLLTLEESLYSISGRIFRSTISLKEHFRCVPDIIGFSNRYYNGSILPLREVSLPGLGEPVRVVWVRDALSVSKGQHRINQDEARAVAEQVQACVQDPRYEGLTMGVVTMMSGPQAQIIQDRIRELIGDAEFENRRLRVGNPPLFQGDERNVMFISMIAHDESYAATLPRYSQWANVAASRAQDQLWIFHSMDPETLHHDDQRRAMIEYGLGLAHRENNKSLVELTESKFERDVLDQLLQKGYTVTPQHRVGNYRIDFVVNVAPGERLAVECDGDSFHGPDKWDEDVRRQRVLERLGWTFWRIRASSYYIDPEGSMEPLWDKLSEMRTRYDEKQTSLRIQLERQQATQLAEHQQRAAEANSALEEGHPTARRPEEPHNDVGRGGAVGITVPAPDSDTGPSAKAPAQAIRPSPQLVRKWARTHGYSVGDRGRLPAEVYEAYAAAVRSASVTSTAGESSSTQSKA